MHQIPITLKGLWLKALEGMIQPLSGLWFFDMFPRVAPVPDFAALRRGQSQPWAK
jgi:hypothetical protein